MKILEGISAANGIALAKAYRIVEPPFLVERKKITDIEREIDRFRHALAAAKKELSAIHEKTNTKLGREQAAIFSAHLLVLNDRELISPIENKIKQERVNAEQALLDVTDEYIAVFEKMENAYMRDRTADLRDVRKQILSHLLGVPLHNVNAITEAVIIVADELSPSVTAQLNRRFVKGILTDTGTLTSHSAIMARTMEIPAVVGAKRATELIEHGDFLIIDGIQGRVFINPTEEMIAHYEKEKLRLAEQKRGWEKLVDIKTFTADGHRVKLAANIGTLNDLAGVLRHGAEGIGLFRTEFLYMERNELPSEEEQFASYKHVLKKMAGKHVVARTLDIGGDKELSYLQLPQELNPSLGFRAIRLCLAKQGLFRTQLRALLRASPYGQLKIMFPMIACVEEFRQAKAIFQEEKERLLQQGVPVAPEIETGIMIEIPSAALIADQLAQEADFFCIGTNDLIQYTMAADRMNERVSYLYQPYHPAILRLIKMVVDAAHREGKRVSVCGEMAGDEEALPLLLGLGLDELSMNPASILKIRARLLQLSKKEMENVAKKALQGG